MVMDFGFIKEVMMKQIHEPCDHGLILWEQDYEVLDVLECPWDRSKQDFRRSREGQQAQRSIIPSWLKLLRLDTVPTAENLAKYWHAQVFDGIWEWGVANKVDMQGIRLDTIYVHETPNCVASYSPSITLDPTAADRPLAGAGDGQTIVG